MSNNCLRGRAGFSSVLKISLGLWLVGTTCAVVSMVPLDRESMTFVPPCWLFPSFVALLTLIYLWRARCLVLWHLLVLLVFAGYEFLAVAYVTGEQRAFWKVGELLPAIAQFVILIVLWVVGLDVKPTTRGFPVLPPRSQEGRREREQR